MRESTLETIFEEVGIKVSAEIESETFDKKLYVVFFWDSKQRAKKNLYLTAKDEDEVATRIRAFYRHPYSRIISIQRSNGYKE